jgi:hypothetical protein
VGSMPSIIVSRDGKVLLSERGVFKQKGEFIAASLLVRPPSLNAITLIIMGFLLWNSFTSSGAFTFSASS